MPYIMKNIYDLDVVLERNGIQSILSKGNGTKGKLAILTRRPMHQVVGAEGVATSCSPLLASRVERGLTNLLLRNIAV